ncbi:hypothetical protein LS68_009190 [Helicobacter sp. MIT 05-5293]|uniref:hypothetical protein n=1 Tax=Helicobacter sp. MIT 05-5293 TaxID=1548149 RepID=UPI0010FE75BE|nr:hypothetical protein [Helicobacter sp. MIT 05-5293]TLD79836.1 hypothetical protein LS68_009190 [Helicobacter sp. MIT 05-5293]
MNFKSFSQKEKGFIPSSLPLTPKRIKPPLFLFGKQGESLALSASSSNRAEALLPPLITIYAPRSGRERMKTKESQKILVIARKNHCFANEHKGADLASVTAMRMQQSRILTARTNLS